MSRRDEFHGGQSTGEDDNSGTITVVEKYRDVGNGLVSVWKARRDAIEHRLRYLLPIVEDPFARLPSRERTALRAISRDQMDAIRNEFSA